MSNANRDAQGRWSSANIAAHTPGDVANAGGSGVNPGTDPAPRGAASSISPGETPAARQSLAGSLSPSSSIAHDDHWAGAADQTSELLNHSGAGPGGGMGEFAGADKPEIPDYEAGFGKLKLGGAPDLAREVAKAGAPLVQDAALRAAGYSGPEGPGMHTVSAPGGRSAHGSDIGGSGIPRPGDYGDGRAPGGDDWGGGDDSGGGAPGSGLGGPRDWSQGI
jgi:hypothetical protein